MWAQRWRRWPPSQWRRRRTSSCRTIRTLLNDVLADVYLLLFLLFLELFAFSEDILGAGGFPFYTFFARPARHHAIARAGRAHARNISQDLIAKVILIGGIVNVMAR